MPDPELWDPCPSPSRPGAPAKGSFVVGGENQCPALFATLSHIVPSSLAVPWLGREGLTLTLRVNQHLSLLLPPSSLPLLPHSAPPLATLWSVPPPMDPHRGPAAALLCHLLSHPAAHPLHVHQPLPGHLHHFHHLPQCSHHVLGALQPARGEPQPRPSPGSHGGGAQEDPTIGAGWDLSISPMLGPTPRELMAW